MRVSARQVVRIQIMAEVVEPDFENVNDPAPSAELPGSATTRRTHKRQLLRRRPPR